MENEVCDQCCFSGGFTVREDNPVLPYQWQDGFTVFLTEMVPLKLNKNVSSDGDLLRMKLYRLGFSWINLK